MVKFADEQDFAQAVFGLRKLVLLAQFHLAFKTVVLNSGLNCFSLTVLDLFVCYQYVSLCDPESMLRS